MKGTREVLGLGFAATVLLAGARANAWYFPEHAELTRLALQDFAPAFVTDVLDEVIDDVRRGGTTATAQDGRCCRLIAGGTPGDVPALCSGATTRLSSVPALDKGACVPYGALAALAGDHANTACDLFMSMLPHRIDEPRIYRFPASAPRSANSKRTTPLALVLTDAARATWDDFQASAPPELVQVWTADVSRANSTTISLRPSQNPRDHVRQLDAALLVLDPDYTSRAKGAKTHFHDATAGVDSILAQAGLGDVDNALGQLVAHHLRSLQLAVWSRGATGAQKTALRGEALMEHAFALHFIEDGLAAGHVATDPAISVDERRASRHDFFNRRGLAVTRTLAKRPCAALDEPFEDTTTGLHPCWVAHGDGFATSDDRRYVAEAAARLQTSFALALAPRPPTWVEDQKKRRACTGWLEHEGAPKNGCDLAWMAFLLDPWPEWTKDLDGPSKFDEWAKGILDRHERALVELSGLPQLLPANAGTPAAQPGVFDDDLIDGGLSDPDKISIDHYDAGASLLRPLLVAWPAARTDVTTLDGGDIFHRGFQLQVAVGAALASSRPLQSGATAAAWFGLGAGVGYTTQGIFPARVNRTLAELNAGFAEGIFVAGSKERFRSIGVLEARAPVTSLLLYGTAFIFSTRWPLALLGEQVSWGLLGARTYFALAKPNPVLVGWDAEVANVYLGTPGSRDAAASGITSSELRLRLGVRSLDFARVHAMFDGAFFVAAEFTSGYYTTLF
jgi:hypothetical protein